MIWKEINECIYGQEHHTANALNCQIYGANCHKYGNCHKTALQLNCIQHFNIKNVIFDTGDIRNYIVLCSLSIFAQHLE